MKYTLKLFFLTAIIAIAITMSLHKQSKAAGTAAGSTVSAAASISIYNATATTAVSTAPVTVQAVYGFSTASYTEEAAKNVTAGSTATYDFTLFNNGNAADSIAVAIGAQTFSGTTGPTVEWGIAAERVGVGFINFGTSGGAFAAQSGDSATATAVPAGSTLTLRLHNITSASASDSAYSSYTVAFKTTNFPGAPYTGYNGITYAGPAVWARQLDTGLVVTTINGIAIYATKSFVVNAPAQYVSNGGLATDTVPGASVTFKVEFANNGASPSAGIVILDTLPANLTYTAGSILSCFSGSACAPVSDSDTDQPNPDCYYISGPRQIRCDIDTLSPGGGGILRYTATID